MDHFVGVLIARAGNIPEMSKQAEEQLAIEYERITGETRKLAIGPVRVAVSYIYGQLRATDSGREALQLAIAQWTAAQVFGLHQGDQRMFPSDADLDRVKAMATQLLEAGKRSWKMPRFVTPLTLEAYEGQENHKTHATNATELFSAIEAGENLVLFGEGGIGKTTFLLDLCSYCIASGHRIPLFIDAAVWARSNKSLFEYLSSLPSAQANNTSAVELTKVAEAGRLVIMLNGWNEMPALSKKYCRDWLIQLTAAADSLNVVVVTRSSGDTPGLPSMRQIEVRGITWQGQSEVVRAELGDQEADSLLDLLSKNTGLRRAARSPLILRGPIAQARRAPLRIQACMISSVPLYRP